MLEHLKNLLQDGLIKANFALVNSLKLAEKVQLADELKVAENLNLTVILNVNPHGEGSALVAPILGAGTRPQEEAKTIVFPKIGKAATETGKLSGEILPFQAGQHLIVSQEFFAIQGRANYEISNKLQLIPVIDGRGRGVLDYDEAPRRYIYLDAHPEDSVDPEDFVLRIPGRSEVRIHVLNRPGQSGPNKANAGCEWEIDTLESTDHISVRDECNTVLSWKQHLVRKAFIVRRTLGSTRWVFLVPDSYS